jgi:hypothetical protein
MNNPALTHLVEGIRLSVVCLIVIQIRLASIQRESGHPYIVKRRIVTSVIAFHPWLDQTQFPEGGQRKINCFPRCVVLVKAQCQNSGRANIVSQNCRYVWPLVPVLPDVLARSDFALFFPGEQNEPDSTPRT